MRLPLLLSFPLLLMDSQHELEHPKRVIIRSTQVFMEFMGTGQRRVTGTRSPILKSNLHMSKLFRIELKLGGGKIDFAPVNHDQLRKMGIDCCGLLLLDRTNFPNRLPLIPKVDERP